MTRLRRIGIHGNDLDGVERLSNLSRELCRDTPPPETARNKLEETLKKHRSYSLPWMLIGHFLGAFGFSMVFGGSFMDGICGGLCGLVVGVINRFTGKLKANQFFSIIAASFPMALLAYAISAAGIADNADMVNIGALMLLVPGLLFTNAMRDIINGDTNSGMNRIIQVFLIAVAIALGTGAAWQTIAGIWQEPISNPIINHSIAIQIVASALGCIGFSLIFNIHGPGILLCALGGMIAWFVYSVFIHLGYSDLVGYFWGAAVASAYAEIMARIRKYPAISYFPKIRSARVGLRSRIMAA
jgi:uncharacterized membrane protein YjjP (DUF1212 family)